MIGWIFPEDFDTCCSEKSPRPGVLLLAGRREIGIRRIESIFVFSAAPLLTWPSIQSHTHYTYIRGA